MVNILNWVFLWLSGFGVWVESSGLTASGVSSFGFWECGIARFPSSTLLPVFFLSSRVKNRIVGKRVPIIQGLVGNLDLTGCLYGRIQVLLFSTYTFFHLVQQPASNDCCYS